MRQVVINYKPVSLIALGLSLLISCKTTAQKDEEPFVQVSSFVKLVDSLLLNGFSKMDSLEVKERFGGNFDSLRQRRILFYFPTARRSISWGRLEQYLLLDSLTIRSKAHRWGFTDSVEHSSYYFLQYLRYRELQPPFKQDFWDLIKGKARTMYPDPRIETFSFSELINYNFAQQREKNPRFKMRPRH